MNVMLTHYQPTGGVWTGAFAQAVDALAAADGGELTVPAGEYRTGPIVLQSRVSLVLEAGAVVRFLDEESAFPLELCQFEGRLEKRPRPCVSASGATDITVKGAGVLDGSGERWWQGHRAKTLSHGRPYLFHVQDCRNVTLSGIVLQNSPTWTIHPLRCEHVVIENVTVKNPSDSPNTDGINPESCKNVRITGCTIDVGDDCITLKSGTEETVPQVPCENIFISGCKLMQGHGGIVIGSEMSGGVKNVRVEHCSFFNTDRGLRIKTQRRRGGTVDGVQLSHLTMDGVLCPFVINLFYGSKTREEERDIWEKTPYPVTPKTPCVQNVDIRHVTVRNAQACAAYVYGLPERPVKNLTLADCTISMDENARGGLPAMTRGQPLVTAGGMFLRNIDGFSAQEVQLENVRGALWDQDESVR